MAPMSIVRMAMTHSIGRQSQRTPPSATYMTRSSAPKAATAVTVPMNAVIEIGEPW